MFDQHYMHEKIYGKVANITSTTCVATLQLHTIKAST